MQFVFDFNYLVYANLCVFCVFFVLCGACHFASSCTWQTPRPRAANVG